MSISALLRSPRNYSNTVEHGQFTIRLVPNNASMQANLAIYDHGQTNYLKAVEHGQIAIDLAPDNAQMQANLAIYYYRQNNYPKAVEHLASRTSQSILPAGSGCGVEQSPEQSE